MVGFSFFCSFQWTVQRNQLEHPYVEEYVVDGMRFSTLDEFYDEIVRVFSLPDWFGRNLDAFNDILRGGFGTPEGGFAFRWKNHQVSRNRLGYSETIRQLEKALTTVHSSHIPQLTAQLQDARASKGSTVFDWLVEIIREHDEGGRESEDNVTLILD